MASAGPRQFPGNGYDLIPYRGRPVAAAQCRRLEAVAALFGLSPTPPAAARVLELGCGSADNLAAQALEFPAARFLGCDASAVAIAAGRELLDTLELRNVELRHQDLRAVDAGWGTFDYILCHGVFSWVRPEVRCRILEILCRHLAPDGVGYVSYNTWPGWHLRRAVRDLVLHHAGGIEDPAQAVAEALRIVALAAEANPPDHPFGALLRDEYVALRDAAEGYLFHEMLEEVNQPFHFTEFLDQVERAGLQYLGEAEPSQMFTWDLPAEARALLDGMPLARREPYLDHLRGTSFRASLLCHVKARIDRRIDPARLERFAVALATDAKLATDEDGPPGPGPGVRLAIGPCELACRDPLAAAALVHLEQRRPEFVYVDDLRRHAARPVTAAPSGAGTDRRQDADPLARCLADAVSAGAVEATLSPSRSTCRISDRPAASRLARLQALRGWEVTNQRQEAIRLGSLARRLVGLLDGTRGHEHLVAFVRQALKTERASLAPWILSQDPEELVRQILSDLRRSSLLVA